MKRAVAIFLIPFGVTTVLLSQLPRRFPPPPTVTCDGDTPNFSNFRFGFSDWPEMERFRKLLVEVCAFHTPERPSYRMPEAATMCRLPDGAIYQIESQSWLRGRKIDEPPIPNCIEN